MPTITVNRIGMWGHGRNIDMQPLMTPQMEKIWAKHYVFTVVGYAVRTRYATIRSLIDPYYQHALKEGDLR